VLYRRFEGEIRISTSREIRVTDVGLLLPESTSALPVECELGSSANGPLFVDDERRRTSDPAERIRGLADVPTLEKAVESLSRRIGVLVATARTYSEAKRMPPSAVRSTRGRGAPMVASGATLPNGVGTRAMTRNGDGRTATLRGPMTGPTPTS
jgi:hypothetical protein